MSKIVTNGFAIPELVWRHFTKAIPTGAIPTDLTPPLLTISGITRVGTVCTVTLSAAHVLLPGEKITIAGMDQGDYNGKKIIDTVAATTFTFKLDNTATPTTPATIAVAATVQYSDAYQQAVVKVAGSVAVTHGPKPLGTWESLSGGQASIYEMPHGSKGHLVDLCAVHADAGSVNVDVMFI